jgi:hypothetical protein
MRHITATLEVAGSEGTSCSRTSNRANTRFDKPMILAVRDSELWHPSRHLIDSFYTVPSQHCATSSAAFENYMYCTKRNDGAQLCSQAVAPCGLIKRKSLGMFSYTGLS